LRRRRTSINHRGAIMRAHPHLYEISAWPWLERLSRQTGRTVTLGSVPAAVWDRIRDDGFDYVYLMGVWRRSPIGRLAARTLAPLLHAYDQVLPGWSMRDVPGSPYSIQAYEPDDRMGAWADLDRARAELARRGLKLVLDFVPNHTGFDHDWVQRRPELYVEGTLDDYRREPDLFHPVDAGSTVRFVACGRDPFFPPWRDVAQLNYFNPETREAMCGVLETIAQHCDAVRCDMAMLVLNDIFAQTWGTRVDLLWPQPADEFWPAATSRVSRLTFMAEVYWDREWQLQQQGMHFTYDKRLLDRLHRGSADDVRGHLRAERDFSSRLVRFLENHDEPRSAAVFGDRLPAAATIAYTLPGVRFFFDGQFDGVQATPPVQLGRWLEEVPRPGVSTLYERLLAAIDRPLFHEGSWDLLDVQPAGDDTSGEIVAFQWLRGASE
jgi:glycosidase